MDPERTNGEISSNFAFIAARLPTPMAQRATEQAPGTQSQETEGVILD